KISESHKGKKNPNYGKHFSDEHKRKISESNKGKQRTDEMKKEMSKLNKGKFISNETKEKMSKSQKGRHHTEETKKKILKNRKDVSKSILQYSKDGQFIREWESQTQASSTLHIKHISEVARNKQKSAGGFIWRFK